MAAGATIEEWCRFGRHPARIPSDPGVSGNLGRFGASASTCRRCRSTAQSGPRETQRIRMRVQRLRRRADEVRRSVLPGVDPVHHIRPGNCISVSLGGGIRKPERHRVLVDDVLPVGADRWLCLRVEKGRDGVAVATGAGRYAALILAVFHHLE